MQSWPRHGSVHRERLPPSLSVPDGDACFVGRADSMAFLHDQFRLARTSGSRTVLVWGDQARVGEVRVTIVEEIVLGEHSAATDGQEYLARTIAARVLAAVDQPPVEIAQPGRFVGPFE